MIDDLVTWLRGQLDRDEQTARAMSHAIEHLESRWSPARLLADVASKRAILDLHSDQHDCIGSLDSTEWPPRPCPTLRTLTLPYRHHRGYREEWRP